MPLLFQCRQIKKDFGIHSILKNIAFDLDEGERVGLVGKNGAGKTTLANVIYGSIAPDNGQINWHRDNVKIGYLRQSVFYTFNILQSMYSDQDNMDKVQDFLHVASELGSQKVHEWEDGRFSALSGGERTKVALAHIWASKPDVLILDEPTNHLDFQGVQWLIDELRGYTWTVIVISHNRYFLDQAVNRIIEIDNGTCNDYKGNYTFYRNEKRMKYESQLRAYENQERYKERLDAQIQQISNWSAKAHRESTQKGGSGNKMGMKEYFRVKAKKMDKAVKSRVKRIEKLKTEGIERPEEEFKLQFSFIDGDKKGKRLVEASDISKAFGDNILFSHSNFFIQRGDRMGVFGPNGCGKTTLIKALMGSEKINGQLYVSPSLKIGYMSQDVLGFDNESIILDAFDFSDRNEEGKIRTLLANMGFGKADMNKQLRSLSLGERTKLKLANLLIKDYDILILDEPTNHLDLHAREQLEQALEDYKGTILLITHDRYMLERICDKLLVFEDKRIKRIEFGLEAYLERLKHNSGKANSKESGTKQNAAKQDLDNSKGRAMTSEEKMILENRISTVLGKLSQLKSDSPEYQQLDFEFKELIAKRQR